MLINNFNKYFNLIQFAFVPINAKAAQAITNRFKNMSPDQFAAVKQKMSDVATKRGEGTTKVFRRYKKQKDGNNEISVYDGNKTYKKKVIPSKDVLNTRSAFDEVGDNIVNAKIPDINTNKYVDSYARNKLSNPSDKSGDAKRYLEDSINKKDATQAGRDAIQAENEAALNKRGAKIVNNTIVAKDTPDPVLNNPVVEPSINKPVNNTPEAVNVSPNPTVPTQADIPAPLTSRQARRQQRLEYVKKGRKAQQEAITRNTMLGLGAAGVGLVGLGGYGVGKMLAPKREQNSNYSYMCGLIYF